MIPKQFRIFRNWFLCDACPNEWSDEAMVIASAYCPCCDTLCDPYDSEALLDDVLMDVDEAEHTLNGIIAREYME